MMKISINVRTAIGAGVVLTIFIFLTALALERAFTDSARAALEERLLGQAFLIMAASEVSDDGKIIIPDTVAEAQLNQPGSGLYGQVTDQRGQVQWRSASSVGINLPQNIAQRPGSQSFRLRDTQQQQYYALNYGIAWQLADARPAFSVSVYEDGNSLQQSLGKFRTSLWGWLGVMALLMLVAQLFVLRWGLRPLREVADDLSAIEHGKQQSLKGDYPSELSGLTSNINTLLHHEHAQQLRYRNSLADLAHSLKTPLAVLSSSVNDPLTLQEQISRMQQSVDYQLQRAATAGRSSIGAAEPLLPLANSLAAALQKVHADKNVSLQINIDSELTVQADAGDLTELLGNLLDNAFKWCAQQVSLTATLHEACLQIIVEDDGAGIEASQAELLLTRGVRADETTPGYGIGLAMVRDIVTAYDGKLTIEKSTLGGAAFIILLKQQ